VWAVLQEISMKADGFVRAREGSEFLGIGESLFWDLARKDVTFPKPTRIGQRVTLFAVAELRDWAMSKRAANDSASSLKRERIRRKA
jgi:predicted DNA-binding transcriptional regulator AlpA